MDSEQGIELGIQNVAMEDIVLNDEKEQEQEKEKQLEEAKMNEKMQEVEEVKDKNKDNNNVGQDRDEGGNTHEDTNTANGAVAGNHANLGYDTAF